MSEAENTNDTEWLITQILSIGIFQTQIKQWLITRKALMPKWQQREAQYLIDMYHDILLLIDWAIQKIKGGY